MKPALVVLLLSSIAFAGCTEDPDAGNGVEPGTGNEGGEDLHELEAPVWAVGDYWTYTTSADTEWSLIVTEETGSDYVVDTDDAFLALIHDQFDELAYVGNINKETLAGEEDGNDVAYFDWPLHHDKTWTANFDGDDYDMVAHMRSETSFHIQAMQNDVIIHQYVYNANAGWFEWFSWGDAEGSEQFRIELKTSGSGWTGEAIRVDAVLAYSGNHQGLVGDTNPQISASGASADSDAFLFYGAQCTQGTYSFGIGTFNSIPNIVLPTSITDDQGFTDLGAQCPRNVGFAGVIGEAPANGDQWGIIMQSASPDLVINYQLYWRNFERITL